MAAPRPSPVSRRDRPAKSALSREGIVGVALELMRREGLPRVTMRRLAQELDTGPASLYVYVRDTEDLHALILDVLLGEIDTRAVAAGDGDWRERLWRLTQEYGAVLRGQPVLARTALVTRLSGPGYLTVVDTALGLLLEGGAGSVRAARAVDVLLLVATASAVEQGTRAAMAGAEDQHAALVAEVARASAADYPHVATVGEDLVSGSGADRSRWAFDALVSGALITPRA